MAHHAQLIVTDYPSQDCVGGLALFYNNVITTALVTSQLLDRVGRLGVLKALNGSSTEPRLNEKHLKADSKQQFDFLCNVMANKYQLVNRFGSDSLSQ